MMIYNKGDKERLIKVLITVGLIILIILLFPIQAKAVEVTAPSFLEKTTHDDLYETKKGWGFLGMRLGDSVRERPILERHPKLRGVHANLVNIVDLASRHVRLVVFSGCRSRAKQIQYVNEGKSWCDPRKGCKGRHLTCNAVDVVFVSKKGKAVWTWDQAVATINFLRGVGTALGVKCLRDGSSWDKKGDVTQNKSRDGFHLEIRRGCKG